MIAEAPRIPSTAEIYDRVMERFRGTLADYLRQQSDRGVLVIEDHEAAARLFGMMVYGEARERALLGEAQSFEEIGAIVRRGVGLFVAGYSKRRPAVWRSLGTTPDTKSVQDA